MTFTLNGEVRLLSYPQAISVVVGTELGSEAPKGVAVAVNGEVIRRVLWTSTLIQDGDAVEIVRATQGG